MKLTFSLAVISSAALVIGFITNLYVIAAIGPGHLTDAFFASSTVPQILLTVITGSLGHVLVPLLAVRNNEDFNRLAWTVLLLIAATFLLFAGVLFVTASFWVPISVLGFSSEAKHLTVELVRVQLVGMVFVSVYSVLSVIYQARRRYIWPEVAPLITGILGLGALVLLLPRFGIYAVVWVAVFRAAVNSVALLPGLGRFVKPRFSVAEIKEIWRRLLPLLGGSAYYKLGPLVDRFLASMAPAGGLSLLNVAQQIYGIVGTLVHKSIAVPMVPVLSKHAESMNWKAYRRIYNSRVGLTLVMTSVGYLALLALGTRVLEPIFGHGRFTDGDLLELWHLLLALGGVLIGGALGQAISPAFYAKGDTWTPTRVGVVGFTLGVVLEIVGFSTFGILGIAAGLSIYYLANTVVLYLLLEKSLKR